MKLSSFLRLKLTFAYKFLENLRELYKDIKTANFESFDLQEIERLSGTNNPIIMDIGSNDGEEILVYFDRVEALCETQKRIILRKKSDSGTRVGGVLKDVKEDEDEGKEE